MSNEARPLWTSSKIQLEDRNSKANAPHVTIKVDQVYKRNNFITFVWTLLEKVCLKTGMPRRAIHEDGTDVHEPKSKHYLNKCLEEVRAKINARKVEEIVQDGEPGVEHLFNLESWIEYQQINKKKFKPKARNLNKEELNSIHSYMSHAVRNSSRKLYEPQWIKYQKFCSVQKLAVSSSESISLFMISYVPGTRLCT